MKPGIFSVILTYMLLSTAAIAGNKYFIDDKDFVEIMLGQVNTKLERAELKGSAGGISVGRLLSHNITVEGSYLKLDDYTRNLTLTSGDKNITNYDISGVKLGITKHFPGTNGIFFSVNAGILKWSEESESETFDTTEVSSGIKRSNDKGFSPVFGMGASYIYTHDSRLILKYESTETENTKIKVVLLGVMFDI